MAGAKRPEHSRTILVLQGGGALGAYQAGVYEALHEADIAPDWVTGVSIGAINAALIVGNSPENRIERLREFWERVSSGIPLIVPAPLDWIRVLFNRWSASASMAFGVPGFSRRASRRRSSLRLAKSARCRCTILRRCVIR